MTRFFNDYASISRDCAEQNLSSVIFRNFVPLITLKWAKATPIGTACTAAEVGNMSSTHDDTSQEAEEQQERDRKSHIFALAGYE